MEGVSRVLRKISGSYNWDMIVPYLQGGGRLVAEGPTRIEVGLRGSSSGLDMTIYWVIWLWL